MFAMYTPPLHTKYCGSIVENLLSTPIIKAVQTNPEKSNKDCGERSFCHLHIQAKSKGRSLCIG